MKRIFGSVPFLFMQTLLCCFLPSTCSSQVPSDVEARVDRLVKEMTLQEKLAYIGGIDAFYIRDIPRLGIPRLKMSDGPLGVRTYGPAPAYPSGIAMASTWNVELQRAVGTSMGKDARARGVHFLLAPAMNIYRAPMCGRNFEYFGEDPYLASRMAVASIQGIQSQGVIATAKHFMGNNQEWDRYHVSSDIDERTMREIYLPAFEASVKEAHVGAIMDSYNLVNGVHMTQNGKLNGDLLKKEWGFPGIVMSDWDATYDGVAAANGAMDLEMPSGKFMSPATLSAALNDGRVSPAVIDDKVRRILRTAIQFGFFDREQKDATIPVDNPEASKVSLQAAQESMVLLKNSGLLPIDKSKVRTIAVLGPNADSAVVGGGGSSIVQPFHSVSVLDGIRQLTKGTVSITYGPGMLQPVKSFRTTEFTTEEAGGQKGLRAEFFNNTELKGNPSLTRVDEHLAFDWGEGSYAEGQPVNNFSARWSGYFTPRSNSTFTFHISGDDGFRVFVDDKLLVEQWQYQGEAIIDKKLELQAGHHYKIRVEYFEGTGQAKIGFGITAISDTELKEAVALARKADVVILCLGFDSSKEGEGSDRPFNLPEEQIRLFQSTVEVNPNVVVVIHAGGNVNMVPWLDSAKALLYAWYPGQEGGTAVSQILFGEVNPSGKLPISMERKLEDGAAFHSYYDKDGDKHVPYTEGLFVGYRHFDRSTGKPLFPFGYGLSYTSFQYSDLAILPLEKGDKNIVKVSFRITNTGKRAGAEIAQIYVSDLHSKLPHPVKELKGFSKINLQPGESSPVEVFLDRRAFSHWDSDASAWTMEPGAFSILVGSSSIQINLQETVKLN